MVRRTFAITIIICCAVTAQVSPQSRESTLSRLRSLGISEAPGAVPVFYVPEARERALRLQKSLEVAHAWYQKQLSIEIPVVLAVIDEQTRTKIEDLRAWMYWPPTPGPRVIVIHAKPSGDAPPGADRDHSNGGILDGEQILFHDDGHILADALKIHTNNKSMQEFVAGIFMIAYIRAQRPDMNFIVERLNRLAESSALRKYSSIADCDYLDSTPLLSNSDKVWFMQRLGALAGSITVGQGLPIIVEKLQRAFPPAPKRELPETIQSRLEMTWPGLLKVAGPLAEPSAIRRVVPSACETPKETVKEGEFSYVVVQNSTTEPLRLVLPNGRGAELLPQSWFTYRVRRGESIEVPGGTCLVGQEQPSLAVIRPKP